MISTTMSKMWERRFDGESLRHRVESKYDGESIRRGWSLCGVGSLLLVKRRDAASVIDYKGKWEQVIHFSGQFPEQSLVMRGIMSKRSAANFSDIAASTSFYLTLGQSMTNDWIQSLHTVRLVNFGLGREVWAVFVWVLKACGSDDVDCLSEI